MKFPTISNIPNYRSLSHCTGAPKPQELVVRAAQYHIYKTRR